MNWRRGLLLAGIHLAVAVPLIVMLEARDEAYMREHYGPPRRAAEGPAPTSASSGEEGQTIALDIIDLCKMSVHYPPEQRVPTSVELPAAIISGWQQVCPPRWTLAGGLNVGYSWLQSPSTIPSRRKVDWGFGLLVAIQWFLVGGFPLTRPKRRWLEPGAFITICAVLAFGLVLISPIRELSLLPASSAVLAWFWWFGLLLWKCARSGLRFIASRRATAS
jgi:hypothetical protein